MNPAKRHDLAYIHFLIAAQKTFTCTEAARCQPESPTTPAHDAFTRLLQRQPLDTKALWQEARAFVDKKKGLLVLDDTTLDKPYAQKMERLPLEWQAPKGSEGHCSVDFALDRCICPVTSGLMTSPLPERPRTSTFGRCLWKPRGEALR